MSRPRHIPAHCPQLRTADLVARYGFTERHWRKLAAEGRIPGATQPCGSRGHWVFDARLFAAWWEAGRREAACRISTAGAKFGGAAPSVRGASTAEVSRQRIERLHSVVLGNGSGSLKRLPGATSRGARLKKQLSGSSVTILRP